MTKGKASRKKMVGALKEKLVELPERERKSFLRGWMQADKALRKPKKRG